MQIEIANSKLVPKFASVTVTQHPPLVPVTVTIKDSAGNVVYSKSLGDGYASVIVSEDDN